MNKILTIVLLLFTAVLLNGCTAESSSVQAANPIVVERPTQAPTTQITTDSLPKYCTVTQPPENPFVPPASFKQEPYPGQFFYGTESLWTAIPTDHTWYSLPYTKGQGYGQKLFFQRVGYDWMDDPEPDLIVNGRQIDPEASEEMTIITSRATNGYTPEDGSFMLVGAEIPTTGCWEITGRIGEDTLTYTIWIAE